MMGQSIRYIDKWIKIVTGSISHTQAYYVTDVLGEGTYKDVNVTRASFKVSKSQGMVFVWNVLQDKDSLREKQ